MVVVCVHMILKVAYVYSTFDALYNIHVIFYEINTPYLDPLMQSSYNLKVASVLSL